MRGKHMVGNIGNSPQKGDYWHICRDITLNICSTINTEINKNNLQVEGKKTYNQCRGLKINALL